MTNNVFVVIALLACCNEMLVNGSGPNGIDKTKEDLSHENSVNAEIVTTVSTDNGSSGKKNNNDIAALVRAVHGLVESDGNIIHRTSSDVSAFIVHMLLSVSGINLAKYFIICISTTEYEYYHILNLAQLLRFNCEFSIIVFFFPQLYIMF